MDLLTQLYCTLEYNKNKILNLSHLKEFSMVLISRPTVFANIEILYCEIVLVNKYSF